MSNPEFGEFVSQNYQVGMEMSTRIADDLHVSRPSSERGLYVDSAGPDNMKLEVTLDLSLAPQIPTADGLRRAIKLISVVRSDIEKLIGLGFSNEGLGPDSDKVAMMLNAQRNIEPSQAFRAIRAAGDESQRIIDAIRYDFSETPLFGANLEFSDSGLVIKDHTVNLDFSDLEALGERLDEIRVGLDAMAVDSWEVGNAEFEEEGATPYHKASQIIPRTNFDQMLNAIDEVVNSNSAATN